MGVRPSRYAWLPARLGPRPLSARRRATASAARGRTSRAAAAARESPAEGAPEADERYDDGGEPLELFDEGRQVAYSPRRFLPQGTLIPVAQEVTVREGDRLDLVAYRTLGDPEEYWRIADANNAMDPPELVARPGRRLRVPLPETESDAVPEEEQGFE